MLEQTSNRGGELVNEMIRFSQDVLKASAVIFAWAESTDGQLGWAESGPVAGLDASYETHYRRSIAAVDPLRMSAVESNGYRIQRLADFRSNPPERMNLVKYESFLMFYGFSDEVDLVMWDDDTPVAALGLFKKGGSFEPAGVQWSAVQRFMQHHFSFHPRVVRRRETRDLQRRGGLTMREVDVALLLRSGASNAAIADELGISLATTKTHIVNILSKLGIQSRAQIGAMVSRWSA